MLSSFSMAVHFALWFTSYVFFLSLSSRASVDFNTWHLFSHYFVPILPSFGESGRQRIANEAFPGIFTHLFITVCFSPGIFSLRLNPSGLYIKR